MVTKKFYAPFGRWAKFKWGPDKVFTIWLMMGATILCIFYLITVGASYQQSQKRRECLGSILVSWCLKCLRSVHPPTNCFSESVCWISSPELKVLLHVRFLLFPTGALCGLELHFSSVQGKSCNWRAVEMDNTFVCDKDVRDVWKKHQTIHSTSEKVYFSNTKSFRKKCVNFSSKFCDKIA